MKGPIYHCLLNSLCSMVLNVSQCTSIKGLLEGVKERVMLGVSMWKLCINWSTKVGNLCAMFRVINRSCQPSALYGVNVTHSIVKVILGSAKTRQAILTKRPTSFWA